MIHGGVHVGRLFQHHLHLLCSQGEGQEAQDDRVKQCDDSQGKGPANSTASKLVVVSLWTTDSPDLVIVPAGREGEETDQQTEARHELHGAADLEDIRGSAHEEEDEGDDAEDADDDSDTHEDRGGPEGWGENGSEVIQTASADISSILAGNTPPP